MRPDQNHYRVLGVPRHANLHQIRTAYVALLKRHHPDSSGNPRANRNGVDVDRIVTAYKTLKDPRLRAAYDAELRQLAQRSRLARQSRAVPHVRPAPVAYVPRRRRKKKLQLKVDPNHLTYVAAAIAAAIGIQLLVWGYQKLDNARYDAVASGPALVRKLDDVPTPMRLEPVARLAGMLPAEDANKYSARCFSQANRSRSPTAADLCVAFDTAFVYWRETTAGPFTTDPYFQGEAVKSRYANAYSRLDPDAAMVRIASIRSSTFQALLRIADLTSDLSSGDFSAEAVSASETNTAAP